MTSFDDRKILACVTGASGFIGAAVALRFLDLGHSLDAWRSKYDAQYGKRLEVVLLGGGIEQDGVFDEIVEGCEVVVHVASPSTFTITTDAETDILKPALAGTLSMLNACKRSSSVKAQVLTERGNSAGAYSSLAGLLSAGPETVIDENSWNDTTYEEAAKSSNGVEVYLASKALAEKAAWEFVQQPDVHFSLSTVGPVTTYGPNSVPGVKTLADVQWKSSFGMTVSVLWDQKDFPREGFRPLLLVGINDVALVHISAALNPATSSGKRYFLSKSRGTYENVVRRMVAVEPDLKPHLPSLPEEETEIEKSGVGRFGWSGSRAEKDFGFKYEPFESYAATYAKQVAELARAGGEL
ncbi:hypothetical protein JCM8097_002976 [Rhodosporidiobolus ruineniae]